MFRYPPSESSFMSRRSALLSSLGTLLFASTSLAQQITSLPETTPPPSPLPAVQPLPGSYGGTQEILQRLADAEAEIQSLKAQQASGVKQAAAVEAPPPNPEADWDAFKKKLGTFLDERAANTYPSVKINGVFQADVGFYHQDEASVAAHGQLQDGADFRRARLAASGSVTETVNYFFQMDFAFFGRPTFTDVWVEQTDIPVLGNVRFGQWKQPFSLEVVSSFRYTTFMERSLLFQPFTPFRHLGLGFYNHSDNLEWTWAASGFRTGQDQYGGSISTDGGWGTAERLTWCPYYDVPADGRYYTHLGVGHFFNNPPHDLATFRSVPEFFVGEQVGQVPAGTSGQPIPGALNGTPFFVNTNPILMNHYNVLGTEFLWVNGPLSVQSESMFNWVDQISGPSLLFPGAYCQVGYFLTGEHRPYNRVQGAIDRVKPFTNFFCVPGKGDNCTGWGAWEIAARWSFIDLNDRNIQGGKETDFTAGVNWFWNAYTKMVFNYIYAINDNPTVGRNYTDIFAGRIQVDF